MADQLFDLWARRSNEIIIVSETHALTAATRVRDSHKAVERSRNLLANTAPLVDRGAAQDETRRS